MHETIIKVREENGQCKILMSKEDQNGNLPDQKIATQLVHLAQKAMNPQTAAMLNRVRGNPLIAQVFNQLGIR